MARQGVAIGQIAVRALLPDVVDTPIPPEVLLEPELVLRAGPDRPGAAFLAPRIILSIVSLSHSRYVPSYVRLEASLWRSHAVRKLLFSGTQKPHGLGQIPAP